MASSRYTPQLTVWHVAEGDCVEHEGTVYAVRRRHREEFEDGVVDEDERECVEIGGKVFAVADEKEVAVGGGKVVRCVDYLTGSGVTALRLTVTEGNKKEVAEVAEVVEPDGELRLLDCGGSYRATAAGTREHVVDVQGEEEAFVLLVSVCEEEARIVRVQRLN